MSYVDIENLAFEKKKKKLFTLLYVCHKEMCFCNII